MPWPQAVQEGTLQVYTNAQVQDFFIPKRGPGAGFMVRMGMTPPDLLVATNTHLSHSISHPSNYPWSHHFEHGKCVCSALHLGVAKHNGIDKSSLYS